MLRKPKIIFVGNYNRQDYVRLLEASKGYCEFYFLFYASQHEETNTFYKQFGQAIYWSEFESAQQLLDKIRPDKVVFLYVESYNHVVLNLACRENGIPTLLLEHGLRADYVVGFDSEISRVAKPALKDKLAYYSRLLQELLPRLRSRRFLNNSIAKLSQEHQEFATHFNQIRQGRNYLQTFRELHSDKRLPDFYIGFSTQQYKSFLNHEAPYFGGKPLLIGIPYFDNLATIKPGVLQQRAILFIDQPLAEQGLLQWTPNYKKDFTAGLLTIILRNNYKLYVKLHPAQSTGYWPNSENLEFINDEQLQELSSSIPLVMGFYSTYLLPFAAMPHTTLLTFENHPAGKFDVSRSFIEAEVAHPVYSLEELPEALDNMEQLHRQQLPNKKKFEQDWLYKFDGKAGERLRDILLSDEL